MTFTVKNLVTATTCLLLLFITYRVLFLNDLLFWPHDWSKESAYVIAFSLGIFSLAYLLTSLTGRLEKRPKLFQSNSVFQE